MSKLDRMIFPMFARENLNTALEGVSRKVLFVICLTRDPEKPWLGKMSDLPLKKTT